MNDRALLMILRDVTESLYWLLVDAAEREKRSPVILSSVRSHPTSKTAAEQLHTIHGTLQRVESMLQDGR